MARAERGPSTGSGRTEAESPLDAERAFAADAQTLGQWTAFRKWAARDATMFVPQPINAQSWLKDRTDPAKSVEWWPTASYVSCDGALAVNTGGWKRPDGSVGYFSTVWQRQQDGGWKWIVDGGDELKAQRNPSANPAVVIASCGSPDTGVGEDLYVLTGAAGRASGNSPDRTLFWYWSVAPNGERSFSVAVYNGKKSGLQLVTVIDDKIAAPK